MTEECNNDAGRVLPHSIGVEKAVISVAMKFPDEFEEHAAEVERDWFYLPAHQILFDEVKSSPSIDLTLIPQRLHDKRLLDHVGGSAGIVDVYTYAPAPSHLKRHVAELRDKHARRLAIYAAHAAIEEAYDCSEGGDSPNYLQALQEPISRVFDVATGSKPPKDIKALARAFLERFESLVSGDTLPMGIPFGINQIDAMLPGMHRQHYGIISGRSGSGKSTLACEIMVNVTTGGSNALYLILERTEESAFAKAVIQTARIHHEAVTKPREFAEGNPTKETLIRVRNAISTLISAGIHIRKPDNRRLSTILAEIRRYVRVHGVQVIFIDQIGLIRGHRERGDSEEVEKRATSNRLQELAHELGICIVVLCQESVDGETKGARAIEEDADWWLAIVQERDKKKENFGEHQHILIAKDSHNGKGGERLPLILDKETLRFVYGIPNRKEEQERRVIQF